MEENKIIIYQTEDGQTQIDVRLENETVWLTQAQMVELFQTTKQNVSLHVGNVFKEGELEQEATVKEYLTVQKEGKREVRGRVRYYNLDVKVDERFPRSTFSMNLFPFLVDGASTPTRYSSTLTGVLQSFNQSTGVL